eukprot:5706866-Amphidinium_carterae.1
MRGDVVPSYVTSSFLSMIPKAPSSILSPAEFHPLSLFNCPLKAVLKCLGHSLGQALSPWAHLPQWAVIPKNHIHDSQVQLECKCAELVMLSNQLCLLDLQRAFSSASRKWTKRVFRTMGIPLDLERL